MTSPTLSTAVAVTSLLGLPRYVVAFLQQMESYSNSARWNIVEGSHKITLTLTWNFRKTSTPTTAAAATTALETGTGSDATTPTASSSSSCTATAVPISMDHNHHSSAAHSRRGLWGKFQKVLKLSRSVDDPNYRESSKVASSSVPEKISRFLQTPPQKHERGTVKLHHTAGSQLGFWSVPTARKLVPLTSSVSDREIVASTSISSTPTALAAHSALTIGPKASTSSKVPAGGVTAQRPQLRQQKSEDSSLLYDSSHFATISKPQGRNGLQHRTAALSHDPAWPRGGEQAPYSAAAGSSLTVGHSWASVRTLSFGDDGTVQALHAGACSRPWTPEVERRWAGSRTADSEDALNTPDADEGDADSRSQHRSHPQQQFLHHQPHLHQQHRQYRDGNSQTQAMYRYNSEPRCNDLTVLKPLQNSPSRLSCKTVNNDDFMTSTTPRQRAQTAWSCSNMSPATIQSGRSSRSATNTLERQLQQNQVERYRQKQQNMQQSRSMHLMHVEGTLINCHYSIDNDDDEDENSSENDNEATDDDSKADRTDSETEQNFQMVCDTLRLCFDSCDNILGSAHHGHSDLDTAPSTSTDIF